MNVIKALYILGVPTSTLRDIYDGPRASPPQEEGDRRRRTDALILFSRLPIGRETKTRLAPLLDEAQREGLHRAMWADVFAAASELEARADLFLYWTGGGDVMEYRELIPPAFRLREQEGDSLGERMARALGDAFEAGYSRALLMGTDVPGVAPAHLRRAFDALSASDLVLGPSLDGGYWLVGMSRLIPEVFDLPPRAAWGGAGVLSATLERARGLGVAYELADTLLDLDAPEDVEAFLSGPASWGRHTRSFLFDAAASRVTRTFCAR